MRIIDIVALCLAGCVASEAQAVPLYKVTRLDFSATALNNRGQIVGSNEGNAVLWHHGNTLTIGSGAPVDINNRGQVLGSDWLWSANSGAVSPGFTHARRMNDSGQVIGGDPNLSGAPSGYVWDATGGTTAIQIGDELNFFHPWDINNSGTVVLAWDLWAQFGNGVWRSSTDNHQLPAQSDGGYALGNARINDAGYIAGTLLLPAVEVPDLSSEDADACASNGCRVIALWDQALAPTLVGYAGDGGGVNGLNNRNYLVGSFGAVSDSGVAFRALLGSIDTGLLDLNSVLRPHALSGETHLVSATSINDRNWIIAQGSDGRSYLLRPVPEPSTITLMLLVMLAAGIQTTRAACSRRR
jgi:hypothetical protein